jgi:hypothetical protein
MYVEEVKKNGKHHQQSHAFFSEGGDPIIMTAIAFALIGFMAGLFTMTVISLYKYVLKKMNN